MNEITSRNDVANRIHVLRRLKRSENAMPSTKRDLEGYILTLRHLGRTLRKDSDSQADGFKSSVIRRSDRLKSGMGD